MLGGAMGGLIWVIPTIHRSNWPKSALLFGYGLVIFAIAILLTSVIFRRWIPLWIMPLLSLGVSGLAVWGTLAYSYCQKLSFSEEHRSLDAIQAMRIAAYPTLLVFLTCGVCSFVLRKYGGMNRKSGGRSIAAEESV